MLRIAVFSILTVILSACGGPEDTPLPKDLTSMDSVKSSIVKLNDEDKELVTAYILRYTLGAKLGGLFGGKDGLGIPEGMTIGKAIEEQRKFKAEQAVEETKAAALKEKLRSDRDAAMKSMREVVTVVLVSKKLRDERGSSGIQLDEHLEVTFGYKNNSPKDIAGVKGYISVRDLFNDEISGFAVSNDETIRAGETKTWSGSRSVKFAMGQNKDRKLAELSDDKFKIVWEPKVVVFTDGNKLTAPE
jgi:hypothetical protein